MHELEFLIPLFGMAFTFGIPGIIIFWYLYSRHRERMRLIEKGLTPEEVKSYFQTEQTKPKPKNPYASLKFGILLTFTGLGIFLGNLLYELYDFEEGFIFGVVICFAGLGLLLYFIIVNAKLKNDEQKNQTKPTFQNQTNG
jgi:hypothetical protein